MAVTKTASPTTSVSQAVPTPAGGRFETRIDAGRGPSFQETLSKEALTRSLLNSGGTSGTAPLRFSQHAVDRMRSRGIAMNSELMGRLEGAVHKAAAKGSRDALVLGQDSAFVVSVKNNTVVTVMDREMMKENVFTNIDSTVLI